MAGGPTSSSVPAGVFAGFYTRVHRVFYVAYSLFYGAARAIESLLRRFTGALVANS